MLRSTRTGTIGLAALALALSGQPATAQENESGIFGDDFARDSGTIVVTGERRISRDLFEAVEIPESSCLASAPEIGADQPGFTIDASGMKKISQLERIRRKTQAGTIFVSGGNFVGAEVEDARLYDMCFFDTDFSQTDWTGFAGSGIGFVDVDLTGAKLAGTRMPFVLFRNTKLAEVDARQADWTNGQLDGGWEGTVRNLNLAGANLTGFQVECGTDAENGCPTEREGVSFAGANLRRASLYSFYLPDADLNGATIDQTELALEHLDAIENATVVGPIVLRSPRRAMMLFPAEAQQLAEIDTQGTGADPCAGEQVGALTVLCNIPGSEAGSLLRSVQRLEAAAVSKRGYAEARTQWLANRDACMENPDEDLQTACVLASYKGRQAELREVSGAPDWLTESGYRLFLSSEAAFPTTAANPGLYGRVLPIMLDGAVAALIVRVDDQGTISARGVTDAGCGFQADNLIYDSESGTLDLSTVVRRRRRSAEPLLSFAGGDAEIIQEGLATLESCAEASEFPRLKSLALGTDLLHEIWDRF